MHASRMWWVAKKKDSETAALGEGPDPKVVEFLHILDEYRVKCEDEGNYLEAGRASKQLETLKKQEGKRQEKALRARQLAERQDVQIAHNMQYAEFNAAWDKYLEEYDQMAQMYIQQMTERHATTLREFQEDLHRQLMKRPPKYSKELLDWRRRQNMLARQKNYAEAQKIKRIADVMEERERLALDERLLAAAVATGHHRKRCARAVDDARVLSMHLRRADAARLQQPGQGVAGRHGDLDPLLLVGRLRRRWRELDR